MSSLPSEVMCLNPTIKGISYSYLSTQFTVQTWFGLQTELTKPVQVSSAYIIVTELSQTIGSSSSSAKEGSEPD